MNVCTNRKAKHEYEVIETLESGIVLNGCEVKSLRNHKCSLDASYAYLEKNELWLINCDIEQYKFSNQEHQAKRKRKLLLKKNQIKSFAEKGSQKGFTIIPLRVYFKDGVAKVELGLCRGKTNYDKRQSLKKKDSAKEMKSFKI